MQFIAFIPAMESNLFNFQSPHVVAITPQHKADKTIITERAATYCSHFAMVNHGITHRDFFDAYVCNYHAVRIMLAI